MANKKKFKIWFKGIGGAAKALPTLPITICTFDEIWPFLAHHFKIPLEGMTIISSVPLDEAHVEQGGCIIDGIFISFERIG